MSARKQYHDKYEDAPYSEREVKEQADYLIKYPKVNDCWFEELCDKWRPFFHSSRSFVTFMLVSYENCGATFGIQLRIDKDEKYTLATYEMSGYTEGHVLQTGSDLTEINKFTPGFEPAHI